jgi:hypothetical protein
MAIKPGTFNAADAILDGQQWGGGVIKRPPQVAGFLNSTRINRRLPGMLPDGQADMYEGVNYGFTAPMAQVNRPPQFQYVQGDAYKGLLPWEVMAQIPERNPWE